MYVHARSRELLAKLSKAQCKGLLARRRACTRTSCTSSGGAAIASRGAGSGAPRDLGDG